LPSRTVAIIIPNESTCGFCGNRGARVRASLRQVNVVHGHRDQGIGGRTVHSVGSTSHDNGRAGSTTPTADEGTAHIDTYRANSVYDQVVAAPASSMH
jgi:hypothetical protein